jgi:hypothetical protein
MTQTLIGPGIFEPVAMLVFRQNPAWEGGGFCHEEEAIQFGADRGSAEAG